MNVEIPGVYYAHECPYNVLSTMGLRHEQMFLDTRRNVLYVPGLGDMATDIEDDVKYQELDVDGHPVFAFKMAVDTKPILVGAPVNRGVVWSNQSSPTSVIEDQQQWHHVAVAAIGLQRPNAGGAEVPHDAYLLEPAFLAHLSFHQSTWVLKRMQGKAELYGDLNLKVDSEPMGNRCHGCRIGKVPAGNFSANDRELMGQAKFPGEQLHADLAGPVSPVGIGGVK